MPHTREWHTHRTFIEQLYWTTTIQKNHWSLQRHEGAAELYLKCSSVFFLLFSYRLIFANWRPFDGTKRALGWCFGSKFGHSACGWWWARQVRDTCQDTVAFEKCLYQKQTEKIKQGRTFHNNMLALFTTCKVIHGWGSDLCWSRRWRILTQRARRRPFQAKVLAFIARNSSTTTQQLSVSPISLIRPENAHRVSVLTRKCVAIRSGQQGDRGCENPLSLLLSTIYLTRAKLAVSSLNYCGEIVQLASLNNFCLLFTDSTVRIS